MSADEDRVAVTCPACEEKYLFKSSKVPQLGGSFLCKVCRARVFVADPRPDAQELAKMAPSAPDSTGLGSSQARAGVPFVDAEILPKSLAMDRHAGPGEILCPNCGESFTPSPKRGTASPETDRHAAPSGSGAVGRAAETAKGRATVLVVEDTEFFLRLAAETLAPLYRPLKARTAREALAHLAQEPVALVILDITLEREEDGLEVLSAASARGIPSLIFTARNEAELWGEGWVRLQELGAKDLLLKGMNIEDQLLGKVAELLSVK